MYGIQRTTLGKKQKPLSHSSRWECLPLFRLAVLCKEYGMRRSVLLGTVVSFRTCRLGRTGVWCFWLLHSSFWHCKVLLTFLPWIASHFSSILSPTYLWSHKCCSATLLGFEEWYKCAWLAKAPQRLVRQQFNALKAMLQCILTSHYSRPSVSQTHWGGFILVLFGSV